MNALGNTPCQNSCAQDRVPLISLGFKELLNSIGRVGASCERLVKKIEPVCMPDVPTPCPEKAAPDIVLPSLGVELRDAMRRLDQIAEYVECAEKRVEL